MYEQSVLSWTCELEMLRAENISRSLKVKMDSTKSKPISTFLFMFHSNRGHRMHHSPDTSHFCSQWPQFDLSRSPKVKMDSKNWKQIATFLFMFNSNHRSRNQHYPDRSHFIASDLNLTFQGHSRSKWTTLIESQ